ncbi:unnamed protein product [Mucor hiemalis]
MAPILPPPSTAVAEIVKVETPLVDIVNIKKNGLASKKKKKKSKKATVENDLIDEESVPMEVVLNKPLPDLIKEVIQAMEIEEQRLKEEEEALFKASEEARLNKPPAIAPATFSPLDASHPPLPPPKDEVVLEEDIVTEPEPERLSLEEDYPNRTIDPDEVTSSEYREKMNNHSNQWYFDEYSGLYRQNAPTLHQSLPNIHTKHSRKASDGQVSLHHLTDTILRSNSTILNRRPPSLALRLRLSRNEDTQSIKSTSSKVTSISEFQESADLPAPTSIDEVKLLKKRVRSMQNRRKNLDLCRLLMDTACRGEVNDFINESPIPGTPPVNTRYRQQELRRKKKKDLMLEEVLVLEAQKILKRLASGTVRHGTDGDAQFLLANCYGVGGLGLPLDREKAFALFVHASKQNHSESTYRAAVCYELGVGTRRDYSRAMVYYRKAATLSHVASMYKLAIISLRGFCGQVVNVREAITWLQRAAALASSQNPHALYALALFQFTEEFTVNTNLIADPSYALELLNVSAQLEYAPSRVKLGELYEIGGPVEVDDALSIYWYTLAAEQGNADAALALSRWYLTGSSEILPQSDREAYLWARKAASYQYADRWTIAKAYFLIGTLVDRGIGIENCSIEEAILWFKRAAALGHKGALNMIDKLTPSPRLIEFNMDSSV